MYFNALRGRLSRFVDAIIVGGRGEGAAFEMPQVALLVQTTLIAAHFVFDRYGPARLEDKGVIFGQMDD